jgi:hypothetical protein
MNPTDGPISSQGEGPVSTLILFLATACAQGQTQTGGDADKLETPPYQAFANPVGIVTGDPFYGLAYAWTGWPGPPAVKPPGFCHRGCACRSHRPGLPPPPVVTLPSYKAPPTPSDTKTGSAPKDGNWSQYTDPGKEASQSDAPK